MRGECGGGRTFRVLSAHDLLDETKQNGDDDGSLKRLTKDDEENGHGEDSHLELELELAGSDLVNARAEVARVRRRESRCPREEGAEEIWKRVLYDTLGTPLLSMGPGPAGTGEHHRLLAYGRRVLPWHADPFGVIR